MIVVPIKGVKLTTNLDVWPPASYKAEVSLISAVERRSGETHEDMDLAGKNKSEASEGY